MATTFQSQLSNALGPRVKVFPELKKVFVRPLIQIAVKAINGEHIEEGILDRISQKYSIPEDSLDEYYAAVYAVIKTHLSQGAESVKPGDFRQSLEELRVSPECVEDLSTVLYGQRRPELVGGLLLRSRFYSRLVSCRWRVDVTIASSALIRVLEPRVIMEWIFDTGERKSFELSLAKFHQLRHAIATILVEMQSIEQQCLAKNLRCG